MRDVTKKRLALGFLIAAVVFLISGVYFLASGVGLRRKLKANEHANLLELSADLSKAGEYKGRFIGLETLPHATWPGSRAPLGVGTADGFAKSVKSAAPWRGVWCKGFLSRGNQ